MHPQLTNNTVPLSNIGKTVLIVKSKTDILELRYFSAKSRCSSISRHEKEISYFFPNCLLIRQHHNIMQIMPQPAIPLCIPSRYNGSMKKGYLYLKQGEKVCNTDILTMSWQPVGKPLDEAKYTCRHGMSYSKYSCDYKGIAAEQTLVVKIKFYPKMYDWHMK